MTSFIRHRILGRRSHRAPTSTGRDAGSFVLRPATSPICHICHRAGSHVGQSGCGCQGMARHRPKRRRRQSSDAVMAANVASHLMHSSAEGWLTSGPSCMPSLVSICLVMSDDRVQLFLQHCPDIYYRFQLCGDLFFGEVF